MSEYIEELYKIYIEIKKINSNLIGSANGDIQMLINQYTNSEVRDKYYCNNEYEIGELYMIDNWIFLLISEFGNYYIGYKVTEWVEFATSKDFIFKFEQDSWMAIMEKLYIPKKRLGTYIGKIEEKYIDILFDFEVNNKKIPSEFTGLTVPTNAIQYKFREKELDEVKVYIISQFIAIDEYLDDLENEKIIQFDKFKNILADKINNAHYPVAAHSERNSIRGKNFILFFNKFKNILRLELTGDTLREKKVVKIKLFGEKYIFYKTDNIIEIEIINDNININYIAQNLVILNE